MSKRISVIKSLATAGIVLACGQPFAAVADCDPQFTQYDVNGFGNSFNRYVWSSVVYNDQLYIGIQNERSGGQIWRTDGETRKQRVVTGGLTTPHNIGPRSMEVCLSRLWAGTDNVEDGAEIWSTTDGATWTPVLTGGAGIAPTVRSARALYCTHFNDIEYLYIGLQDGDTGGKIVRTTDGVAFQTIVSGGFGTIANSSIHAFQEFNGQLYAGTANDTTGMQIWRTTDGRNFENVVGPRALTPGGFGHERSGATTDFAVFNGQLYVGNINAFGGFGVYATPDGINWTKIGEDGFGFNGNDYAWDFAVYENALWLGTLNNAAFFNPGTLGAGVWRTFDGTNWEEMVGSENATYLPWGFGDPYNMGVRKITEYHGKLYIGTAQDPRPNVDREGFELWVWPGEACPAN
jgi:hypothetical protein